MQTINTNKLFLIAGPCAIEREETAFQIARSLKATCTKLDIPLIFKASFKKANRTRLDSFTGIGDIKAINILKNIKEQFEIPITTDVHEVKDVEMVGDFVDVIQIPAFLCRQTDLLVAAAKTGKIVNIKKGQFLAANAMQFQAEKVTESGNKNVWLTERGTTFGYSDLVVDFRNIPIMNSFGFPVIMDCTHSLQQPNTANGVTGGKPELIETIAKAAIATGANGLFMETHPEPKSAKSDAANMLPLHLLEPLLVKLKSIYEAVK